MDEKETLLNPFLFERSFLKKTLITSLITQDKATFLAAIKQAANLMVRDTEGNTLLHLAAQTGQNTLFFTNTLLELEAIPINSRNNAKETPLYIAVKRGNLPLVRLLMAYNANPYAENNQRQTPISLCISKKQSDILSVFTGVATVDMSLERLKLRETILNLTNEINLVTDTLNQLPHWFEKLPLRYHDALLNLQKNLYDRDLAFNPETEDVKGKKLKDNNSSLKTKEKKSENKFSNALKYKRSTTEKENKNERTTQVLKVLHALISAIQTENNEKHQVILNHLDQLVLYYDPSIVQETTVKTELSKQLRIQSTSFGYRELSEAAAKRFALYFINRDDRQNQVNYKSNEYGLHDVIQMNSAHYKISPTAPGIEYAVHALGEIFTGQVSAPTELLVVEKLSINEQGGLQIESLPVLASQTISGILLRELLEQQPLAIQKIDPYSFSLQCILALLTCPADGKPDNFIAKPQFDEQGQVMSYSLVSIDSDEAFANPISESFYLNKKNHSLALKTCIFCLPQMDDPVDTMLRRQLLTQNPASLVLAWLQLLWKYNEAFEGKSIATHYLKETLETVGLPQRLVPKTAVNLYQKFCQIQDLLRQNPALTHRQLLEKCYSLISFYYDYIRKESEGNLVKSMELIYRGKFFAELSLSAEQKAALTLFNQKIFNYQNQRKQPIIQAAEEFCEHLNFAKFDLQTQQAILRKLMVAFPNLKNLTLNQCDALNDAAIEDMSKHFKQLTHITLRHCRSFSSKGMHALLQAFPALQVTLEGFEEFKPHDLLTILRFCSRFYLIFPDSSKHLVSNKNQLLLPTALKHNNVNLMTFLLLAGFHLTEATQIYSPLYDAINKKNAALVRELLCYHSDANQYVGKLSQLDKAYQLLQATPPSETETIKQLHTIITLLLEAGAIETASAEPILGVGIKIWQEKSIEYKKSKLAKALINFALAHNQLNATLVNTLVDINETSIDWSRQRPFGYQVSNKAFQALFPQIKSFKSFDTLNLSGCTGLTKQHIQICSELQLKILIIDFQQAIETEFLKGNTPEELFQKKGIQVQINAIALNGKKAVQEQFDQLIRVLSQPQNEVKRLEITNSVLSTVQIQKLANALKQQTQLKRIMLRGIGLGQVSTIGESHFSILMKGLASSNLIEICLDDNHLKADNMAVFSVWLKNNPQLLELSLYRNPLGDQGMFNLCATLYQCKNLKKLNLNEIGLTDDGFKKWLSGYAVPKTAIETQSGIPLGLTYLDIGFNQLTAASVPHIMEAVRLNESLSEVLYAGQPDLEKGISSAKLTQLLQRNNLLDLQKRLLEPYEQKFFQANLTQKNASADSTVRFTHGSETKAIWIIKQLSMVIEEETDEIEQMTNSPWSYQEEKKAEIDHEIEYNDLDQTALEGDISYLLQSNEKLGQELIVKLREQIQILVAQQTALQLQYDRKTTQQAAIFSFNYNPGLCLFYHRIHLALEKLFTECKLAMGTSNFTPTFKDKKITLSQANYIDQLGSLKILLKVAEQTGRYLTEFFQEQIKTITKGLKKLDLKTKQQIENISDREMTKIFDALASQNIGGHTVSAITKNLISASFGYEIELAIVLTPEIQATTTPFWQNPTTQINSESNSSVRTFSNN